ncbi:hypothetical protein MiSe_31750 [Microseira wollei NIES-4236]|uniref:Uncharacterized protein n=1 Tax=Microseira wollei NIES-4236 TaxID=2530354 RepID=A0AAV3X6B1_9CYAN|nr:hypothetical protein MiSe_31750 [Microseira wollei NIES-4236]
MCQETIAEPTLRIPRHLCGGEVNFPIDGNFHPFAPTLWELDRLMVLGADFRHASFVFTGECFHQGTPHDPLKF